MNIIFRKPWLLLGITATALFSCGDLFEYHPYDLRVEQKYHNTNAKNLALIEKESTAKSDSFKFAFIGDSQSSYDEIELFVKAINKNKEVEFVVHGGDMTDFGLKKEYLWTIDRMTKLRVPHVSIIGNHDILGQGSELYQLIYGKLNFSFKYKGTKFVLLNTCALEFDYSLPVPDFQFISQEIQDSANINQTIVMMHVEPGDIEFNNNVKEVFQEYIKRNKELLCCVHAHAHRLIAKDYFEDGIMYYGCDNIADKNYLLFTIYPNGYKYEVVTF